MGHFVFLSKGDETKFRIFHSIDRPIEELTIDTICKKAMVSKTTFYRHFASKYDVARWISDFMCRVSLDEIGRTLTWDEGLRAYFAFGLSELEFLGNVRMHAAEYEKTCNYRSEGRCKIIAETLEMHGVPMDLTMQSVIEGHVKIELHFSEERLKPTRTKDVEEIVSTFKSFIPLVLYKALEVPFLAK